MPTLAPLNMAIDGRPALVIRTLQPHAADVQLMTGDRMYGMQRRRTGGLFEAKVPFDGSPEAFAYRFRVRDGAVTREHDEREGGDGADADAQREHLRAEHGTEAGEHHGREGPDHHRPAHGRHGSVEPADAPRTEGADPK